MNKTKKMFGIVAAVVLVIAMIPPSVTSDEYTSIDKISSFLDRNYEDLAAIDQYFEDAALSRIDGEPILEADSSLMNAQDNLVMQWNEIIQSEFQSQPSLWTGITAFFESVGNAQYFEEEGDYELYHGHCKAFDKQSTDLICCLVLVAGGGVAALFTLLIALMPILGFIYGVILGVILALFWPAIVTFLIGIFALHPYGMVWFHFDNVNSSRIIDDRFPRYPQPSFDWDDPSYWYSQTPWVQVWP